MDAVFVKVIEQAPTVIGLVIAVWILYRQNERLMGVLFERITSVELRLAALENQQPPYPADVPVPYRVTKKGSREVKGGIDGSAQV